MGQKEFNRVEPKREESIFRRVGSRFYQTRLPSSSRPVVAKNGHSIRHLILTVGHWWTEAWRWVYQIQNLETRKACAVDLVSQKIRSLNAAAKYAEEISSLLKKDFVHLGLEKKEYELTSMALLRL